MTNFEYYKDKILEVGNISEIALTNDGELQRCYGTDCDKCVFDDPYEPCQKVTTKWLYEEHVEKPKPPKLTRKEYNFCELLERGYISRDSDGELWWYSNKPAKESKSWYLDIMNEMLRIKRCFNTLNFDFIKWKDEEPWSVEELLKLEVED